MSAFWPPTIRIIDDKGALRLAVGNAYPEKNFPLMKLELPFYQIFYHEFLRIKNNNRERVAVQLTQKETP